MKRLLLGTLLGLTLTACEINVVDGGAYGPIATDSLADVEAITTRWVDRGDATSIRVAIPSTGAEGSLLVLMSESQTRIAASQFGVAIASSRTADSFVAGGSAYTPAGMQPSIISDPVAPPDENLYRCNGPCLALDPTEASGIVTFSVRNLGPSGFIDLYAAWIDVGDVTEPDNDVRRDVPLRSTVGTSLWGAIETLGDVDWFYASQNHDYEIITPEFVALRIRVYDGGGSTGFECDLDADEIYGFDAFQPIDAFDDVRIEARFSEAASYYGGEYEIRTVTSPSFAARFPDCSPFSD